MYVKLDKFPGVLTLRSCIWTTPGSNLCLDIDYLALVFRAFPLLLQDNVGIALQITYHSFHIPYDLLFIVILPFDAI
jgi:hypothetical protein